MLIINLIYNTQIKTVMNVQTSILLLSVPYSIYCYIWVIFNDFLLIHPFSYNFIIFTLFFLTYLILYMYWELEKY